MSLYNHIGILSAVGNTPTVQLKKICEVHNLKFNLFAKLENLNPAGSLKDRPARAIILNAIERGEINTDTTIIEYSSGNTGIGLSQVCRYLQLRFICIVDPRCNVETIKIMEAFGTRVIMLDKPDLETNEYLPAGIAMVKSLLTQISNSYWANQHANEDNSLAHQGTMEEIMNAVGRVDYLFCATSTCGTIRGCGEFIQKKELHTKIVAVDAVGSSIFSNNKQKRLIPGHGAGLVPGLLNRDLLHEVIHVSAEEAVLGAKHLLHSEAIFAGGTTGAIIHSILNYPNHIAHDSNCVMIVCDRGERYLNTIYSDRWCAENLQFEINL